MQRGILDITVRSVQIIVRDSLAHALMEVLVPARGVTILVPVTLVSMVTYATLKKMPVNHHPVSMATVWISYMVFSAAVINLGQDECVIS